VSFVLEGEIPATRAHELQQLVPRATRGEGVLEYAFDHYEPVTEELVPKRARTDLNPLNRREYLGRVLRATTGWARAST
jgi:ribosomal protection tetracycline resistance protein